MAVQLLDITKNWFMGTTVIEQNWDNIRDPLLTWAQYCSNDINQLRIDMFGISYSLDNDGQPNLSGAIRDWTTGVSNLVWIFTNAVAFTSTVDASASTLILPDTFIVNQATADYTMTFADPAAARVITFDDPLGDDAICYLSATQTLLNKTLSSPNLTSPVIGTSLILEQASFDYTITWADPAAARALNIVDPLGDDTFVFEDATQTLTNKELTSASLTTSLILNQTSFDYTLTWADPAAARALNIIDPLGDDTFVFEDASQTLTNKTLTSPTISSPLLQTSLLLDGGTHDYTLTWAAPGAARAYGIIDAGGAADFVMTAGSQTLASKTLTQPTIGDFTNAQHDHSAANKGGTIPWSSITGAPALANVTYDNVAESISEVWDFTVGAQLQQIRIEDNDIYERDSNSTTSIKINRYGYNGGLTKHRGFGVYDGHGMGLFSCNRVTMTLSMIPSAVNIVSVETPTFYAAGGVEAGQTSLFFTSPVDFGTPGVGGPYYSLNGTVCPADAHVTRRSLAKAWISFRTNSSGVVSSTLKSYNLTAARHASYDLIVLTFTQPMSDDSYVVVSNAWQSGTWGADDFGSEVITTCGYKHTTYFHATCYDTDAGRNTADLEWNIVVYGTVDTVI